MEVVTEYLYYEIRVEFKVEVYSMFIFRGIPSIVFRKIIWNNNAIIPSWKPVFIGRQSFVHFKMILVEEHKIFMGGWDHLDYR